MATLFRNVFSKSLKDPATRRKAIATALRQARVAYASRPTEEARETILRLQDAFDEQGIDRLELLYAAEAELTADNYWLRAIGEILLRRQELSEHEIAYLLRLAFMEPTRLDVWRRIFKERLRAEPAAYYESREQATLTLLPYFPDPENLQWPEPAEEDVAYSLFLKCLNESIDDVLDRRRKDPSALELLRTAMAHLAERADMRTYYATMVAARGEPTEEDLAVVLEALVTDPENTDLKRWAGRALVRLPGHLEEGLGLLYQVHKEHPGDTELVAAIAHALRDKHDLDSRDARLLSTYIHGNSSDLRATERLADYYLAQESTSDEALAAYRAAAAHSPKRVAYLRMIGKASASRADWARVIEIFHLVNAADKESTDDLLVPLATAYAEFDKNTPDAIDTYRRAVRFGTRNLKVHSALCRHLYVHERNAPTSIAQFHESARVAPACQWARLGLANHYCETGDRARALEEAVALLTEAGRDTEALRIAAKCLAQDFSRKQLARVSRLPAPLLRDVFEEAHLLAPDAGPISLGLARRRIADNVADSDTARLLGEVSRQNPDATDLRIARADILWRIGQRANAATIYRELLERWRTRQSPDLPRGITPEIHSRLLRRAAEAALQPPGPTPADVELLLEAAAEPNADSQFLLATTRALIDLRVADPRRVPLLERALALAPSDLRIERALAEASAARGNPRPALQLAARLLKIRGHDDEITALLRAVITTSPPEKISREIVASIRKHLDIDEAEPALLLAFSELLGNAGLLNEADVPMLELLLQHFPRNARARRRLANTLNQKGDHREASEVLESLLEQTQGDDDDLLLEIARTNARLGRHLPKNRRYAQRAVDLQPDDPELILHLAAIELEDADFKAGSQRLERLLRLAPETHPRILALLERYKNLSTKKPDLCLLFARVHILAGHGEQALTLLGRLHPDYQSCLGDLLELYDEVIQLLPDNPRPFIERAILRRVSGQVTDALDDMRTAHRLAPDNHDITGEFADMLQQRVVAEAAQNPQIALECAQLYMDLADDPSAFEVLELLLDNESDNADALRLMARLQLNAGSLHTCWKTLRRIGLTTDLVDMMQQLARAFSEQDEPAMAVEVLTEAIEIGGNQKDLLEQIRGLYQQQAVTSQGAILRRKLLGSLGPSAQNRYDLQEQIGSGAMGVVYKAYDNELEEIVVLKILPEHFAEDAEALARFRNEAKAARKLAHPNICRIHDIGQEHGRKHISMEFVGGGDLRRLLRDRGGRLPLSEALRIVRETAEALAHAHAEGVLHRDIKSANILLTTRGRVKLSDFGIAALAEAAHSLDPTDSFTGVVGTPLYMSPEAFEGENLTTASDLYSLGVLFYEILSGTPPFTRGSISYHHRFTEPTPIDHIPPEVWATIARLLAKDPADRIQSARELLETVASYEQQYAADTRPDAGTPLAHEPGTTSP